MKKTANIWEYNSKLALMPLLPKVDWIFGAATIFLTRSKMILETALNFKHAFLFTLGIFDFIVTSQTRKPISNDDKRFAR